MTTIKATIRNGRIEVDAPIDLPDGTELTIPIPNLVPPVGIQVYSALIVQGLPLQPEAVGKRLQAFYSRVDELYATSGGAAEPEDQKPGSEVFRYLKAATKATNDKYARADRGEIISKLILSMLPKAGTRQGPKPKKNRKSNGSFYISPDKLELASDLSTETTV